MEEVAFGLLGGLAGLAANPILNKALAGQSEQVRNTVGTVLPLGKVVGGGYLAQDNKQALKWRLFGLGLAAEGGMELGIKYAPQYMSISGVGNGDVFDLIGNTSTVSIPIRPAGQLSAGDEGGFEMEQVLGVGNDALAVL